LFLITAYLILGYLEGIIPYKITTGYHIIITLTKLIQIEFGRKPFFLFQKNKRIIVEKTKTTKAKTTRKTASKKQTKRKAAEVKDKTKKDLDLEGDDLLDKLEESKVIYIKEKAPVAKKQKAKNIIEVIIPKRNIRLVAKRFRIKF
jgi:hypothetical protein